MNIADKSSSVISIGDVVSINTPEGKYKGFISDEDDDTFEVMLTKEGKVTFGELSKSDLEGIEFISHDELFDNLYAALQYRIREIMLSLDNINKEDNTEE